MFGTKVSSFRYDKYGFDIVLLEDGAMRLTLLGELDDTKPSRLPPRPQRTSQTSRQRFHQPLSNSVSSLNPNLRSHVSYSTRSTLQPQEAMGPFVPSTYAPRPTDESSSPYQQFVSHLKYQAQSQHNLEALDAAFKRARDEGAFKELSVKEAVNVLHLLADQIDSLCIILADSHLVSQWGFKMEQLYSALPHETVRNMKQAGEWDFIICRMISFMGNFNHATPMLKRLVRNAKDHRFAVTYDSFLMALARHRSLFLALETRSEPEMKKILSGNSKFGQLVARDPSIEHALFRIGRWKDKSKRAATAQYCLKVTVLNKSTDQAQVIIKTMGEMGVVPYFEHVLAICKFLAVEGNLDKAKKLFDTIPPNSHQFYSQTKLYLYARSGDTAGALKLLEERRVAGQLQIEDRSNVLLSLSIAKRYDEMKGFFEVSYPMSPDGTRSPKPPLAQYSICVLGHARAGDVESVNWWLQDMEKQGVKPNLHFFTHLIALFKKIGDDRSITLAYNHLLQSDIRPDPPLYTLMLSHFANRKNSKAADALFMDAIKQGVVPDEKMTSALMNAHVQSGSWQEALRIFQHLSSNIGSRKPIISVYNTMFKAHLLLGAPFKVMTKLFLMIKKLGMPPDSFTYAILILSACEARQLNIAMEILDEIKEEQRVQNRTDILNPQIMTIVMSAYLRYNDRSKAKQVLDEMIVLGLQPTDVTYSAIVRAYGTSRMGEDMKQAEAFVKRLLSSPQELRHLSETKSRKQPVANLYVPLMVTPSEDGNVEEVERLYDEFVQAGGRPTISVYHKLLLAYRQADDIQKALDIWPMIERLAERETPFTQPPEEDEDRAGRPTHMSNIQAPLSIYLDVLSKFGMHDEVANTWFRLQKRGFQFDAQNWNHLVVVLIRAGQVERSFEVMEKVLLPNEQYNDRNSRLAYEWRKTQGKNKSDPLESYVPVPQGTPLWGSEDRVRVARLASFSRGRSKSKAIDWDKIDKDFVYPIRVLEFIRPTWNDWRPHDAVWRTLLVVWLQLEKNYLPKPLERGGELLNNVTVQDISDRNPEAAEEVLMKLNKDYPKTVQRIFVFLHKEQSRLSKETFDELYVPH